MVDRSVRVRLSADNMAFIRGMQDADRAVTKVSVGLAKLSREVDRVDGRTVRLNASLDATAVQAEIRRLESRRGGLRFNATLDTSSWAREARAAADRTRVIFNANLNVRGGTTVRLRGELDERDLQRQLDRMRLHVRVRPRLDPVPDLPGIGQGGGGGGGSGGLNAASLLKGATGAAAGLVALLPQAVSLLSAGAAAATALASQLGLAAAAGAGLVPVVGALGQGLGGLAVGTLGVREAFKGYIADQTSGSKGAVTSAASIRSAANTIQTAQEGLARSREGVTRAQESYARAEQAVGVAQQSASRAVQSALQAQAQAERNLGDAQDAAKRSQDDLRKARKDAANDLEDLASRAANGVLAEREAVLAVIDARRELAATSGAGEAQAKAQLAYDRAVQSLKDQRLENSRTTAEQKAAAAAGVDGSDRVKSAQDAVNKSIRAEGDARQSVGQAAAEVDQARADGARQVRDAQMQVVDAQRSIVDAQRGVGDSQRSLAQAQAAYADATAKSSDATSKLSDAMAKLGPNQRAFVTEALRTVPALHGIKNAVGEALFAGMDKSLHNASHSLLPLFKTQLVDTGTILNRTGKSLISSLAGPLKGEVAGAFKLNNDLLLKASPLVGDLTAVALRLYNAAGPLAKRITDAAVGFGHWADKASAAGEKSGKITEFFNKAGDKAFSLGRTMKNLGDGFLNVFKIGSEGSGGMLTSLEDLSAKFDSWTKSVKGQMSLRKWFQDGQDAAVAFGGLLGDIRTQFQGLGGDISAAGLITSLRGAVPYVRKLVDALSGGGDTGHQIAVAISEIAQALSQANLGGAISSFVGTMSVLATGVADVIRTVPGVSPVLKTLAGAAGGLLVFKFLASPILGVVTALRQLPAAVQGASRASLIMGGIGIAISAAVIAWGTYKQAQQDAADASDAFATAMKTGTYDALVQAQIETDKLNEKVEALAARLQSRNSLEGLFHPLDNAKGVAAELTGQLQKTRDAYNETSGAAADYRVALGKYVFRSSDAAKQRELAGNYDLMNGAIDAMAVIAEKAGVKTSDSFVVMKAKIDAYKASQTGAGKAAKGFSDDMQTLSDKTATAADKASALKRILDGLSGGTTDAQAAANNFKAALDAVTESVKTNGRGLDNNTASGRANGDALIAAKHALDDHITAMVNSGETSDKVKEAYRRGTAALADSLAQTKGTKEEVKRYQSVLGLTPDQKATELKVLGKATAVNDVQALQRAINGLHGKDLVLKVMANTGNLNPNVGGGGTYNADGAIYYANGGVRESHVAQIARPGDWRVWAEPETGGEAYIPLSPAKRERSVSIWRETGQRLGMYANGGIRISEQADTSKAIAGITPLALAAARQVLAMTGGGSAAIKKFLQSVSSLPYIWGGVGPGGYDCSGLAGEVWARATNHGSFRRYFTTASFKPERFGMRPGTGGVLSLGFNDHHVVGEYGGLPFEAESHRTGIKVGNRATPVSSMPRRYYLPANAASVGAAALRGYQGDAGDVGGAGNRENGRRIADAMGYGSQFRDIDYIFSHESGWNNRAQNPHSSAYGIPQFINATWAQYGGKTSDPTLQTQDGIRYMVDRYGSPRRAEQHWEKYRSYGSGGIAAPQGSVLNPHIRDSGGPLLPGFTFNGTGRPEEVVRAPLTSPWGSVGSTPSVTTTSRREIDVTVRAMDEASMAQAVSRRVNQDLRDSMAVAGLL